MESQSATKNDAKPIYISHLVAQIVTGTMGMVGEAFAHPTIDHRAAAATSNHTRQFDFRRFELCVPCAYLAQLSLCDAVGGTAIAGWII